MADVNLTISSGATVSASVVTVTASIGVGSIDSESQYKYYTENGTKYRQGVRGSIFILDKALTSTGFDGTEGPGDGTGDWENLEKSS